MKHKTKPTEPTDKILKGMILAWILWTLLVLAICFLLSMSLKAVNTPETPQHKEKSYKKSPHNNSHHTNHFSIRGGVLTQPLKRDPGDPPNEKGHRARLSPAFWELFFNRVCYRFKMTCLIIVQVASYDNNNYRYRSFGSTLITSIVCSAIDSNNYSYHDNRCYPFG